MSSRQAFPFTLPPCRAMQLHEDVVRKALRRCAPGAVLRFGATSRGNRALAREEALWEALFVRAGARLRPPGAWAAAAAAAAEDELAPGSWWEALRDYVRHPSVGSLVLGPSRRRLRVSSGALALHHALERAESGDVIELAPGVYPQRITLSRAITLVGDSRDCVQVGSVLAEADGVTLARLTILGTVLPSTEDEAAGGVPAAQPAFCVSAGSARVYDCNLRGAWGIEVEAGACRVFSCDIEAQRSCFRGAGELDACRLEICAPVSTIALPGTEVQAALVFRTGKSRLVNCLVESGSVGVHVESGASCEIKDCDIQATNYGVSVQGSRNAQDCAYLLLQNSRCAHARNFFRWFCLPWCTAADKCVSASLLTPQALRERESARAREREIIRNDTP